MTKLLDIFNAAMAHPRDSAERDAGLRELGEAIKRQARGEPELCIVPDYWDESKAVDVANTYLDWAKRAANDED